jgi:hypothetical protein
LPTFSQVVDNVASRTSRLDKFADIHSYVRSTIRELETLRLFKRAFVEEAVTVTGASDTKFVWTHPNNFRVIKKGGIHYPVSDIWPENIPPGKRQSGEDEFWYGGNGYTVFKGVDNDETINIAYYNYSPRFVYKRLPTQTASLYSSYSLRNAYYDIDAAAWKYLDVDNVTYVSTLGVGQEAVELARREAATDWLLFYWTDLVEEGTVAKVFKTVEDTRARSSFALFSSLKNTLLATEPVDAAN